MKNTFPGLGAAFFPEHHPRKTWRRSVEQLAQAGLSFVRLAEFTWDKTEPREGVYDFSWLDEVLELLASRDIRVILCTPTAVPPLWTCERYPEILPVREDGAVFGFGLRRYTCPTSLVYGDLAEKLVTALARRYGRSAQLMAWQIDNEIGHPFCFCPRCRHHFREWCAGRYGTIERFNDALCTHFLGQTFPSFDRISFPTTYPHPGMWQIYHRFFSDATVACFKRQADTLHRLKVTAPVTTNLMVTWHGYDHRALARSLDLIAVDHYGIAEESQLFGPDFCTEAFTHSYARGLKPDRNIWFHEFQCGRAGVMPLPGQVRWETLTQIGLGADAINYFRFDTCPSGMERDGYGLLGVPARPGRIYDEIRGLAADVRRLAPELTGSVPEPARIAFLYSFANHCEFARNEKHPAFRGPAGNGYAVHFARHFQALVRRNIRCDVVYPDDDFARYEVIVAPACYILPAETAAKLRAFVGRGGRLLLTSFSGVADEHASIWDVPIPAHLSDVFGLEVRDYGRVPEKTGPLRVVGTGAWKMEPLERLQWLDEIRPVDRRLQVLARHENPFFAGLPALTRHRFQRGAAYYFGSILEQAGYNRLYASLAAEWGLKPVLDLPEGVYASARVRGRDRLIFINNPSAEAHEIRLAEAHRELLSGRRVRGRLTLPPFGVLVLK